jgi:regulator of replication initiation timing
MTEITENLLAKLEEKMMTLLTEVEDMRHEIQRLQQENTTMKLERENNTKKLSDLVSLLDSVGATPVEETLEEVKSAVNA